MELGVLLSNMTGLNRAGGSGTHPIARVGQRLEEAGFDRLLLSDHHWWDIPPLSDGSTDRPVLDPFTSLGLIAGATTRIGLGVLVAGVHFRHPCLLIKQVTTLDVLSQGRACFGIGAGWFEDECRGLGIPFPPAAERYALLEDTVRLARLMWAEGSDVFSQAQEFKGKVLHVPHALCSPRPVSDPHPPILIGGDGVNRTIPLVARYADACNFSAADQTGNLHLDRLRERLDRLAECCWQEGREFEEIELTATVHLDLAIRPKAGQVSVNQAVERLHALAELGFRTAIICDSAQPERSMFLQPARIDAWAEGALPEVRPAVPRRIGRADVVSRARAPSRLLTSEFQPKKHEG